MTGSTALQRVSPLWLGFSVGAFLLSLFFVLGRWEVLLSGDHFDPLARVSSGILRDVRITIVLVLVAWQAYAVVLVSTRLSGIAKRLQNIDLLDLSSLAPFTRLGLGNSLLVIGGLSIFSLFSIETGFVLTMLVFGVPIVFVAVIALLYPVRGVRDRIRQKKDAELQTIGTTISARRDSLLAEGTGQQQGAMADLVAYRGLVEAVPEWPFTTSNYVRFVLYMLIPALSWGLGVIAEELIGRALF